MCSNACMCVAVCVCGGVTACRLCQQNIIFTCNFMYLYVLMLYIIMPTPIMSMLLVDISSYCS